jgi:hypothetical protein
MAFSTEFLKRSQFTKKYDWARRTERPTPERVVAGLLGTDLAMLGIKGTRNDCDTITYKNVVSMNLDWLTHCHRDIWAYREFMEDALKNVPKPGRKPNAKSTDTYETEPAQPRGTQGLENAEADSIDIRPVERVLVTSRACQTSARATPTFVASAKVAVVVGGAASVLEEMAATDALLAGTGITPTHFVINDMIPRFDRPCLAISLHPQKLAEWLEERAKGGFAAPGQVWAHVKHKSYPSVTHSTEDWRGSSGLFAIAVARQLGYERIILCGVPMVASAGHVVRGPALWRPAEQFAGGWRIRKASIAPYVRSWSGWTEQAFGRPALDFLHV